MIEQFIDALESYSVQLMDTVNAIQYQYNFLKFV